MAGILFIGFDIDKLSNTLLGSAVINGSSVEWPRICLPRGVYHNRGVDTLDINQIPPNGQSVNNGCIVPGWAGVGAGYGASRNPISVSGNTYTGATAITRATWAAAQGHQLGISRAQTGLSGEFWVTFELGNGSIPQQAYSTSYSPSASWGQIFKFGDVEIRFKEATFASALHNFVFSVRNNSTEIGTVTAQNVPTQTYMFCRLYVKLDATTGAIQFEINGARHAVYTNQNTVQTTSLGAASAVYISPFVLDDGSTSYVGYLDNVYFDDAGWPTGRPQIRSFTLLGDDLLTNMAAYGTSPTTVANALSDSTDAKAMKATATDGSAVLTQTPPSTAGFLTTVVGVDMYGKRGTNRNPLSDRRIQFGYDLAGAQTLGTLSKTYSLNFSNTILPPESSTFSAFPHEQIFVKNGGSLMTTTELATMKVVIKSTAP